MNLISLSYYEIEYLIGLLEREQLGNGSWDPDKEVRESIIDKLREARRKLLIKEAREYDP